MCILIESLSRAHAKGKKKQKKKTKPHNLHGFKFGTFVGRFPSDGSASVAVKGLIFLLLKVDIAGPNLTSHGEMFSA